MKGLRMYKPTTNNNNPCKNCNNQLIIIPHYECDGVTENGSYEPYYECVNGCAYPECEDRELTAEELMERGKVDTCTEFGIVNFWTWKNGIMI